MLAMLAVLRVPCLARMSPHLVQVALEAGADPVILAGCSEAGCHFRDRRALVEDHMANMEASLSDSHDLDAIFVLTLGASDKDVLATRVTEAMEDRRYSREESGAIRDRDGPWSLVWGSFFRRACAFNQDSEACAIAEGLLASVDLLMTLDPHWYSTIFGVYYFAGCAISIFALLSLFGLVLRKNGRLKHSISVEHYHDLGKLLFGFIVFWAYIAFSQYMLIWYGNLPEETEWFLKRQTGEWTTVSLILIFGHFVVPFLLLVSRKIKRRPLLLALTGGYVAIMCWIDIFWLVIPEFSPGVARFGLLDVLCFLGMNGVFSAAVLFRLSRHSVIAEKDPRLEESLAFENA